MNCGLGIASTSMPIFIYYIILYIIQCQTLRHVIFLTWQIFRRSLAIVTAKRSFKRSSQNCNMTLPGSELNLSNSRPRWRWPVISLAATALAWWTYGARHVLMLQRQNTPKHVKALTLFSIYLFDVIPAFDLFSVFLNRSGIAFSDDGSEDIRNTFTLFVWSLARGSWFGQDGYAGRVRTFLYLSRRHDRDRLW